MTPELQAAIEKRYGLCLGPARMLTGGEECHVWCVASDRGMLVVRASPAWRTVEELAWTHDLISFTSAAVPEAVTP
ncbi:MAG: hypothetical protein M3021_08310, partial [Actinomycetota bacterium]|nr:hypothetical protein [Actinomycetota bacterium]